jgi:hypothetical protein
MTRVSFRRPSFRVYPRRRSLNLVGACALVAAIFVAGCGGGGGGSSTGGPPQTVYGAGFLFHAPGKWHVSRTQDQVAASPKPISPELVSVSVFPLQRVYTPDLYDREVSRELDPYSVKLAKQQQGKVVASKDVVVAGIRSRQYELSYPRSGKQLGERITFVFRNKTEYELLCQWDASKSEPGYCTQLTASFRPIGPA